MCYTRIQNIYKEIYKFYKEKNLVKCVRNPPQLKRKKHYLQYP